MVYFFTACVSGSYGHKVHGVVYDDECNIYIIILYLFAHSTYSSILIAATLSGRAPDASPTYIDLVCFLAFMVGVVSLLIALFQVGHIIELLMTYPVMVGRLQVWI